MPEIPTAVQRSVTEFLAAAAKEWRITAAYLYGSEKRGQAGPWSDVDVAVISPDFAESLFSAQLALMQLAVKVDERLEPHAFTLDTFTPNNSLADEIQATGIRFRDRLGLPCSPYQALHAHS